MNAIRQYLVSRSWMRLETAVERLDARRGRPGGGRAGQLRTDRDRQSQRGACADASRHAGRDHCRSTISRAAQTVRLNPLRVTAGYDREQNRETTVEARTALSSGVFIMLITARDSAALCRSRDRAVPTRGRAQSAICRRPSASSTLRALQNPAVRVPFCNVPLSRLKLMPECHVLANGDRDVAHLKTQWMLEHGECSDPVLELRFRADVPQPRPGRRTRPRLEHRSASDPRDRRHGWPPRACRSAVECQPRHRCAVSP